jgi:hypothetical protein
VQLAHCKWLALLCLRRSLRCTACAFFGRTRCSGGWCVCQCFLLGCTLILRCNAAGASLSLFSAGPADAVLLRDNVGHHCDVPRLHRQAVRLHEHVQRCSQYFCDHLVCCRSILVACCGQAFCCPCSERWPFSRKSGLCACCRKGLPSGPEPRSLTAGIVIGFLCLLCRIKERSMVKLGLFLIFLHALAFGVAWKVRLLLSNIRAAGFALLACQSFRFRRALSDSCLRFRVHRAGLARLSRLCYRRRRISHVSSNHKLSLSPSGGESAGRGARSDQRRAFAHRRRRSAPFRPPAAR